MKKYISMALATIMLLTTSACQSNEANEDTIKVALVTSLGGLGDRSFSDSAWEGFQQAEAEFDIEIKVIEPQSVADYQTALSSLASADYDFILGVSTDMYDALEITSNRYPNTKFGAINISLENDNLQVAQFADHEGSFMAGVLAGLMTKTNTVSFVGGADIPAINRFAVGYEEGVLYVNPEAIVVKSFVGSFSDPGKGKEFANQQISQNSDIIFHAAGKTGEGVFEAIKEHDDVFAIGVDQDQDSIVPGKILSSMEKRVSAAAYEMIKSIINDNFQSGMVVYGLDTNGVGLSEMEYTKDIIGEDNLLQIEEIRKLVISGEIDVTDVFEE